MKSNAFSSPESAQKAGEAPAAGASTRFMGVRKDYLLGYLLIAPTVLIIGAVLVYPTLFNIFIAMRKWSWSTPASAPKPFVGTDNFATLFASPRFWNSLQVSLLLVLFGLVLQYVLGLGLALLLNKEFKGLKFFRTIFILPMVMAPIVVGIQWRYLLSGNFGIINYALARIGMTPPSWLSDPRLGLGVIVVVDTWMWLPFAALILLSGLQQIPPEVYEAAQVDGAGSLSRFWYITLPALGPATVTVLLMRGTEIFRTFDVVYLMTGGGPGRSTEVLGMLLYKTAFSEGNLGVAAALALIIGAIGMLLGTMLIKLIRTDQNLL